jgi:hypothetical protein
MLDLVQHLTRINQILKVQGDKLQLFVRKLRQEFFRTIKIPPDPPLAKGGEGGFENLQKIQQAWYYHRAG